MSEAVSQWIREQQHLVEVSGRHAETLRLLGPDEQVWQQWPIDAEGLADQVERMQNALGEQLPTGKHRGMLVVLDNKGDQYSAFPVVFHGRNTAASSAAQESRTLQQSTSIAIANLEQVIEIQRNELERIGKALEDARENEAMLVEVLNEYRTQNLEVDLMMREYEDRKASRENFQQMAAPLLMQFSQTMGPILMKRIHEKATKAEQKRAEKESKKAESNERDASKREPSDGAAVHGSVQPTGAETASSADGKNGNSRSRAKPSRRTSRARKVEAKETL